MKTSERIRQIEAREQAATKGPWKWIMHDESMASIEGPLGEEDHVISVSPCKACQTVIVEKKKFFGMCTNPLLPDADYLAHSRSDIPFLLSEIKRKGEALEQALQHIEADETTHGRQFGVGNVVRGALEDREISEEGK